MYDHDHLIETARQLGFTHVEGKGRGVLEKHIIKRDERLHLVLLTSRQDASMLVHHTTGAPFKFQFKRNYRGAADFIRDYIGDSK